MKYFRVAGRLRDDNVFALRPGHLDERPRHIERQSSAFIVEMLDARGARLLEYPLALGVVCVLQPKSPSTTCSVSGWVPFPEGTRSIRFSHAGAQVHVVNVSDKVPEIALVSAPHGWAFGKVELVWRASHAAGLPLSYFCRYSNDAGETWRRVSVSITESNAAFDLDKFPGGGQCQFAIVATDGVNTTVAKTEFFEVALKPQIAVIRAPMDKSRVQANQPVLFNGQGYVLEEDRVESEALLWTSSRDGILGRGRLVECRNLSAGEHVVTLEAGIGDRCGRQSITIVCD